MRSAAVSTNLEPAATNTSELLQHSKNSPNPSDPRGRLSPNTKLTARSNDATEHSELQRA
ncbi:MAG: hypothetical protein ACI8Y4_004909 [Candidatus Poriferisodalaceae bacterium]|jgi:hypothetical protein